ncbi:hypothetical protein BT96DRAFT_999153 [Gymnopus androsaceus JB14]|uniref:Uncharacterized protein n=1 Tax=Gymnopus androsaceus JB14 TaxID=1447944 RepID=A0A6A4H6G6_9AGAR|nr:hypothetical protein BT96DRAFT_999153 [Gymnopus androsaceus JB14]
MARGVQNWRAEENIRLAKNPALSVSRLPSYVNDHYSSAIRDFPRRLLPPLLPVPLPSPGFTFGPLHLLEPTIRIILSSKLSLQQFLVRQSAHYQAKAFCRDCTVFSPARDAVIPFLIRPSHLLILCTLVFRIPPPTSLRSPLNVDPPPSENRKGIEPLANELIDNILEFLYSDKASLKNCALVGKAWVCASQQGLFETIVFKFLKRTLYALTHASSNHGPIKPKLERFIAMFDEKPYLASYVRSLEVVHFRPDDLSSKLEEAAPLASQVIHRLSYVEHILLYDCEKNMLSEFPVLREALYDIFNLPSLTRVTIQHCRFGTFIELASLLSHATHLKVLTIGSVGCFDRNLPSTSDLMSNVPPRSIKLEEFAVTASGFFNFIPWFEQESCPFQVQDLQFLRMRLSASLRTSPHILVRLVGHGLTKLELQYEYGVEEIHFHLGHLPNLESFTLDNQYYDRTENIVSWFRSFFGPVLNPHPLCHSTLIIAHLLSDAAQWESDCDQFAILDMLFAKPVFSSMETVNIHALEETINAV